MSKLSDYMAEEEETELLQAKVSKKKKAMVAAMLKKRRKTWVEFFDAALQKMIDEERARAS